MDRGGVPLRDPRACGRPSGRCQRRLLVAGDALARRAARRAPPGRGHGPSRRRGGGVRGSGAPWSEGPPAAAAAAGIPWSGPAAHPPRTRPRPPPGSGAVCLKSSPPGHAQDRHRGVLLDVPPDEAAVTAAYSAGPRGRASVDGRRRRGVLVTRCPRGPSCSRRRRRPSVGPDARRSRSASLFSRCFGTRCSAPRCRSPAAGSALLIRLRGRPCSRGARRRPRRPGRPGGRHRPRRRPRLASRRPGGARSPPAAR